MAPACGSSRSVENEFDASGSTLADAGNEAGPEQSDGATGAEGAEGAEGAWGDAGATDAGEVTLDGGMTDAGPPGVATEEPLPAIETCTGLYWLITASQLYFMRIDATDAGPLTGTMSPRSGEPFEIEGWCTPGPVGEARTYEFQTTESDASDGGTEVTRYVGTYLVSEADSQITIRGKVDGPAPLSDPHFDAFSLTGESYPSLTDRERALRTREQLNQFVWGEGGLPHDRFVDVELNDSGFPTEIDVGPDLARVDRLEVDMGDGLVSTSYRFVPRTPRPGLVLFHQGHSNDLLSGGGALTVQTLLTKGYHVVALSMPSFGANPWNLSHRALMLREPPSGGHGLRYFLEPITAILNQMLNEGPDGGSAEWSDIALVGLSGGGWTVTAYAALDPRVRASFPVAGSLPLPRRIGVRDVGDAEQWHVPFFRIASYQDLYLLGALDEDRVHVQILNSHDNCCFDFLETPAFAKAIPAALAEIATDEDPAGRYQLQIDDGQFSHTVSQRTLNEFILPELR